MVVGNVRGWRTRLSWWALRSQAEHVAGRLISRLLLLSLFPSLL